MRLTRLLTCSMEGTLLLLGVGNWQVSLYILLGLWISVHTGVTQALGQPDFAAPLVNVSVPVGRDATFSCIVKDLGGYRSSTGKQDNLQVGWVKADTKAIQAIHRHVITHNSRVSVSHSDHNTWMLHIKGVQEEDRGPYMCQINTDPMRSQIGYLEVTVPPTIDDKRSSTDVMVPEGSTAALFCRAKGYPRPKIIWTREDQKPIVLRTSDPQIPKIRKQSYEGEVLNLTQITRSDMGPYLCIANNSVPPIVSKRIMVEVHFRPVIHVPNQLIGAPLGTEARLECNLEASPKSIQYWTRDTGEMLISNDEYSVHESHSNYYMTKMTLVIKRFQPHHEGIFYCIAKNSLGETEGKIKVYEFELKTESPAVVEEETSPFDGHLGRDGDVTSDIYTNEIPYGHRSWEENTSPTRYGDITRGGYNNRPNHRTPPSQTSLERNRNHHHHHHHDYNNNNNPGGDDWGGRPPTRPPRWGLDQSASCWRVAGERRLLVAFLCLLGLFWGL
ncbi:lachesin-like isoform X1 [Macrobrachium rosenbergii]|uniref:lachesin-like isoform X1 n=1 Tax=Macrobrachium rosenbergii TaxID=79674 RepID=UPI0034D6B2A3